MKHRGKNVGPTLGFSILAAAWMIAGPGWLVKMGLESEKLIEVLTFMPAFGVMFMIVVARPGAIVCERRVFKRMLGIK